MDQRVVVRGVALDLFAVTLLPATFLIDRKGRVGATYVGLVDRSDLERNIRKLLGR